MHVWNFYVYVCKKETNFKECSYFPANTRVKCGKGSCSENIEKNTCFCCEIYRTNKCSMIVQ